MLTNGKERITKDSDDSSDDSSDDDSDDSSDDSSDGDETDSKYSVSGIGPDMEIFLVLNCKYFLTHRFKHVF